MKSLSRIPGKDHEHFMKCSVCENYFDMRDLQQVVDHQHWEEPVETNFTHSTKNGNEGDVFVKTKSGMITLRLKAKQSKGYQRRT